MKRRARPAAAIGHGSEPPQELPADRLIVASCRGPWCVLSFEAVARLRAAGLDARRLQDGLPEWRRAGLPLA